MKLIEQQLEFLKFNFFGGSPFPGVFNIAERLLLTGSCIVAGNGRIWNGGVGNFITVKPVEEAVGCVRLVLDIKSFLKSPFVREALEEKKKEIEQDIANLANAAAALNQLLTFGGE